MNPSGLSAELRPTHKKEIDNFVKKLRDKNITVIVRYTQGEDIAAACGQLAYPPAPFQRKGENAL